MAFSFGAKPAAAPAATTSTPFSFGTPATPAATGSLFGTAAPASTAAQASTPATPSLFGQQQPKPTLSLFGNANPSTPPTGSAPTTSTGLFGQSSTTTTGGGGGLFGAAAPTQTGSLFGAKPAGGGLFGSTPAAPATGTSLFGQSQTQAQPQPSLFGQSTPAPPQQAQAQPLFGQSQSAATASLFGPKPPPPSTTPSNPLTVSSLLPTPTPEVPIDQRLLQIQNGWDPNSLQCRFMYYFYNTLPPGYSPSQFSQPNPALPAHTQRLFLQAIRENPRPEDLIPALAVGWNAVKIRADNQENLARGMNEALRVLKGKVGEIGKKNGDSSVRIEKAREEGRRLESRLLSLAARIGGRVQPTPTSGGGGAEGGGEEAELRIGLEAVQKDVEYGRERVGDLWAGVGSLKARHPGSTSGGGEGWQVVDENGLARILEIIAAQQRGLDHLTKTLEKAQGDVSIMREAFGLEVVSKR